MSEKILELLEKNNGVLTTAMVEEAGISRVYIKPLVDQGLLVRYKKGIYVKPEISKDKYYLFQLKHPGAIFSHETALYLQGVLDEDTPKKNVTVYTGYNTHRFGKEIKSHYIKKEMLEDNVIEVVTPYGNKVKCYNPPRTICDIVRYNKDDKDATHTGVILNEYFSSDKFDKEEMLKCADEMKCYKKLNYLIGVSFLNQK